MAGNASNICYGSIRSRTEYNQSSFTGTGESGSEYPTYSQGVKPPK